ncbi:MAG: putative membrane protein [Maribacter sp.]|jgi:putative membrane protein
MGIAIKMTIAFISILHLYFLWFEMFAWSSRGPKIFRKFPKDLFSQTKSMAANQGLYNGFLAAGLLWTFFIENAEWITNISLFFLGCVAVAGIYGGFTISKKIFYIQALPAIIGIILIVLS